jgi:hypothetical protein
MPPLISQPTIFSYRLYILLLYMQDQAVFKTSKTLHQCAGWVNCCRSFVWLWSWHILHIRSRILKVCNKTIAKYFTAFYSWQGNLRMSFDVCRLNDPHMADDNLLHTLHQARDIAVGTNLLATNKQKEYFDKTVMHHEFHEG